MSATVIDAENTALDTVYQPPPCHVPYILVEEKDKQVKYSMLTCGKCYGTKSGKEGGIGMPERQWGSAILTVVIRESLTEKETS